MGGAGSIYGKMRNVFRILFGNPEAKRRLEGYRHRWEDNIKMNIKEVGRENLDYIPLTQHKVQMQAVVKTAMNFRVLVKENHTIS
jgi:hypothetical protein